MKHVIDIHSHMLPGVDDGCKNWKEAAQMLYQYKRENAEAVFCTPHFGICGIPGANTAERFKALKGINDLGFSLHLGNEILWSETTPADLDSGRARTLAGTDHALIEFEEWAYHTAANDILDGLLQAKAAGYQPILAHPERYLSLQSDHEFCRKIAKSGIKMQINAYDIAENSNPRCVSLTRFLLREHLVDYLGSDAHGAARRQPRLQEGVRWIYENCPVDYADAVVHDNAQKLIQGEA